MYGSYPCLPLPPLVFFLSSSFFFFFFLGNSLANFRLKILPFLPMISFQFFSLLLLNYFALENPVSFFNIHENCIRYTHLTFVTHYLLENANKLLPFCSFKSLVTIFWSWVCSFFDFILCLIQGKAGSYRINMAKWATRSTWDWWAEPNGPTKAHMEPSQWHFGVRSESSQTPKPGPKSDPASRATGPYWPYPQTLWRQWQMGREGQPRATGEKKNTIDFRLCRKKCQHKHQQHYASGQWRSQCLWKCECSVL